MKLKRMNARIVHTMHDEIIIEAEAEIDETVAGMVEESMAKAFEGMLPSVSLKEEAKIQDTWA